MVRPTSHIGQLWCTVVNRTFHSINGGSSKCRLQPIKKIIRHLPSLYSGLGTSDIRAGGRRNLTFENPVYTNDMYNVHRDADRNIQVMHHLHNNINKLHDLNIHSFKGLLHGFKAWLGERLIQKVSMLWVRIQ